MNLKASLLTATLVLAGTMAHAQIVTNGDFSAGATGWTTWNSAGVNTLTYNYTGDAPTGGSGNVLHMQIGGDYSEAGAYQAITLTGGNTYRFDGLAKIVAGSATPGTWMEVWIGTAVPVDGVVYNATVGAVNVTKINTWVCPTYNGTWVAGCETPAGGEFTVPGSGSVQYYLMVRTGVCCAGVSGETLIDNVVVTDLGAGSSFDSPPTPLVEDFDDNDGINNYGGEAVVFAGGDPGGVFTLQDGSMTVVAVDAQGTTGAAGDYAQHVFANTPLTGQTFVYYGVIQRLSPGGITMQNLTSFDELSFDIKLGSGSATTDWAVRIEDNLANDGNAGSYNYIDLQPLLGTSYANVTIPLSDFVSNADGGTIAPNLAMVDVITFVSKTVTILSPAPDIYIDNLRLGQAVLPSSAGDHWQMFQ